jgi:hypothetical protein
MLPPKRHLHFRFFFFFCQIFFVKFFWSVGGRRKDLNLRRSSKGFLGWAKVRLLRFNFLLSHEALQLPRMAILQLGMMRRVAAAA